MALGGLSANERAITARSCIRARLYPCPPLKMLDRESLALYQGTTLVVPPPRQKALGFSPCCSREQKSPGPKGPPHTALVSAPPKTQGQALCFHRHRCQGAGKATRLKSCPDTNPKRGSLLDYRCEAHFHPSLRPAGPCSTLSKIGLVMCNSVNGATDGKNSILVGYPLPHGRGSARERLLRSETRAQARWSFSLPQCGDFHPCGRSSLHYATDTKMDLNGYFLTGVRGPWKAPRQARRPVPLLRGT